MISHVGVRLVPLARNAVQITNGEPLAPTDKPFLCEVGENGVTAGQITACFVGDELAVSTYYSDLRMSFGERSVKITSERSRLYSLGAADDGSLILNGKVYSSLPSSVIFSDASWGIMTPGCGCEFDLVKADDGEIELRFVDEINFVLYSGRIPEMLRLHRDFGGDTVIPQVADLAPGTHRVGSRLPCSKEMIERHKTHFSCFSDFCEDTLDDSEKARLYSKLRYSLIPYIYSSVIESKITGMPLIRPLAFVYHDSDSLEAYNEYLFGRDLLVAGEGRVWLPTGDGWMNYFSGRRYSGGQYIEESACEGTDGLLYVRLGSVIPMSIHDDRIELSEKLILRETPGGTDTFRFYETDGKQCDVRDAKIAETLISSFQDEKGFLVRIGAPPNATEQIPYHEWTAEISGCGEVYGAYVNVRDRDFTRREDGITVVECGSPWLINVRYYNK